MLIVIAGLPEALIGIFFVGNLFIEIIFNLDGIGLLGFEAITQRDYPVIFGTLFYLLYLGCCSDWSVMCCIKSSTQESISMREEQNNVSSDAAASCTF